VVHPCRCACLEDPDRSHAESAWRDLKPIVVAGKTITLEEDYAATKPMIGYGVRIQAFKFKSKKFEKPGRYFHPLLGTLITGAARQMLALAEYQVSEQKLDWAFCDTDSIAIANTRNFPLAEFKAKA